MTLVYIYMIYADNTCAADLTSTSQCGCGCEGNLVMKGTGQQLEEDVALGSAESFTLRCTALVLPTQCFQTAAQSRKHLSRVSKWQRDPWWSLLWSSGGLERVGAMRISRCVQMYLDSPFNRKSSLTPGERAATRRSSLALKHA